MSESWSERPVIYRECMWLLSESDGGSKYRDVNCEERYERMLRILDVHAFGNNVEGSRTTTTTTTKNKQYCRPTVTIAISLNSLYIHRILNSIRRDRNYIYSQSDKLLMITLLHFGQYISSLTDFCIMWCKSCESTRGVNTRYDGHLNVCTLFKNVVNIIYQNKRIQ